MKFLTLFSILFIALTVNAQWDQIGQDVLGFGEETYYGQQVSISDDGSTIAVSAPYAHLNGLFNNGLVRVYRLSNGLWTQIGSDLIGTYGDEGLGESLSLNEHGNILAIASPYGADGDGSVSVYSFDGNDWNIMGAQVPEIANNISAVSLSNDGLTFVANLNTSATVYTFNGNQWVNEAARGGNEVIRAVAISADGTKVIYSGLNWFHHFEKVGDTWTNAVNMAFAGDDGSNGGPSFLSLSGDGNVIAKGAELNNLGGTQAGRVVIIDRTNPDEWTYSYITGSLFDRLGKSVSLNHDGSVLSVLGNYPRIYEESNGEWSLAASIFSGANSAAISGNGAIVATGFTDFQNASNQTVGVMKAFGNLPNEAPSITCPETIQVNAGLGLCGAVVVLPTITGNDLEDGTIAAVQTAGVASSDFFPMGTNDVSFSITDSQGLSATCSFIVEVSDVELPEVVCTNVLLELNESGWASISSDALIFESSDNCGMVEFSIETFEFTCLQIGVNDVEIAVFDNHGNQNSCIAQVTVQDLTAPELSCQNMTVELDETGMATLSSNEIVLSYSDNCNVDLTTNTYGFACEDIGLQSVTITVQDFAGNMASCVAEITVVDNLIPFVACHDIEIHLNEMGVAMMTAEQVDLNSVDNCDFTLSLSNDSFSCDDLGTNTVTLQGQDLSGNLSTCTAVVTVLDVIAPIIECPFDSMVSVTSPLLYTLEDLVASNQINFVDNCSNAADIVISQSPSAGTELAAGDHDITLTVADVSGNENSCSFTITVMIEDDVDNIDAAKWNIYPNPSNGVFTITSDLPQVVTVCVFDLTGRKVFETVRFSNGSIDLSSLESGEYLVKLIGDRTLNIEKVIIGKM